MSTIVVVEKDGVNVIGADTLLCRGDSKESSEYVADFSKIVEFGGSFIGFCGHASWRLVLQSYAAKSSEIPELSSSLEIFEFLQQLHIDLKSKFHLNAKERDGEEFESSQCYLLIANKHGIFGVDSMRHVKKYKKFTAIGSGQEYAMGAMEAVYGGYRKIDNFLTATDIVEVGLNAAAKFDAATGAPFEVRKATPELQNVEVDDEIPF